MKITARGAALALAIAAASSAFPATQALAAGPSMYQNCTNLHGTYPHGIGRADAYDRVSGSSKPVTSWKHDTAGYNKAISYNGDLDRDRDGIACEKR